MSIDIPPEPEVAAVKFRESMSMTGLARGDAAYIPAPERRGAWFFRSRKRAKKVAEIGPRFDEISRAAIFSEREIKYKNFTHR